MEGMRTTPLHPRTLGVLGVLELKDGETVGEYVNRLERRLKELEPPDNFTIQEWHVGQVYAYLLWRDDEDKEPGAAQRWSDRLTMFEERFPEQTKKFADYMGWGRKNEQQV
jgi:hypothetical protein